MYQRLMYWPRKVSFYHLTLYDASPLKYREVAGKELELLISFVQCNYITYYKLDLLLKIRECDVLSVENAFY